ncbi:MAG: VTT domain-containing protein [Pseudomonadota bacterium]
MSKVNSLVIDFILRLLNPNELEMMLRSWGWLGYPILFGIVFAETGLLVGFFFPGDSLLFIAGFVASTGVLDITWLNLLLCAAAILGDGTGYFLGLRSGPKIFRREDSLFFRKSHLVRTQEFYEKHGGKTIVLARFIPIIRTFAPFVAGLGKMRYLRFAAFNVFGGIGWVVLMTGAGYFLGNIPIIRRNFERTVIVIVVLSVLPLVWHGLKEVIRRPPPTCK